MTLEFSVDRGICSGCVRAWYCSPGCMRSGRSNDGRLFILVCPDLLGLVEGGRGGLEVLLPISSRKGYVKEEDKADVIYGVCTYVLIENNQFL